LVNPGAATVQVDRYIKKTLEASGIPGLSIGITDRKHTLWVHSYGYSELESKTKVNAGTLFEIGSISKFFSALVLMRLRDGGLVDVNKPVTKYLPWFKVMTKYGPITLHHLLTHTAGLIMGQEESLDGTSEVWMLRATETGAAPGERFYYSNHGYKTIGLAMERIAGQPVGQLVKTMVLDPLGMADTDPVITNETRPRLAAGYEPFFNDRPYLPGGRLAHATWFESGTADGTICSTPEDMCRYLRMLLNRGRGPKGRIVSEEGFDLMTSPHIKPEDGTRGESYGYGMSVGQIDGHSCLWHTGGMVGFHASIVADLDAGLGIVTMINGPGAPEDVSVFALSAIRAETQGRPIPAINVTRFKEVENPGQYSGEYTSGSESLRIQSSGRSLWMVRRGRKVKLVPMGPDKFFADENESDLFLFRFGRQGDHVVELFHGPDWYANPKYRGRRTFPRMKSWEPLVGHYRSNSPWVSNFRIVMRKGQLALISPSGDEEPMSPMADGSFRVGADPRSPERLSFEMFVEGKAQLAQLSGGRYYRSFTP
jgi:D-alanyl-D-alanine carboxypeptidase